MNPLLSRLALILAAELLLLLPATVAAALACEWWANRPKDFAYR